MNKKVTKAVIPCAGLGTRFLPATKALPKEMFPIIDVPTIQFIVEEAVRSGITDILIIISDNKQAIENHFDYRYELEKKLLESKKDIEVAALRKIAELANIYFIRQKEAKGLGHAIGVAKSFVGDEPFVVLLGDDVVFDDPCFGPATKQLIEQYNKHGHSVLGVQYVPHSEVNKYGIVSIDATNKLVNIVEKPSIDTAPSNLAVLGRYLFTADIFRYISLTTQGKGGEIQLTDAIQLLSKDKTVQVYDFKGVRHDVGDKFGYLKASIEYALSRDDLRDKVVDYLKNIVNKL